MTINKKVKKQTNKKALATIMKGMACQHFAKSECKEEEEANHRQMKHEYFLNT